VLGLSGALQRRAAATAARPLPPLTSPTLEALAWLPPSQMLTKAAACSYPDVQGAHLLLRYDTVEAGCCRVLLHPRWRSKCYPGTVFTTADVNTVRRLLKLPPP